MTQKTWNKSLHCYGSSRSDLRIIWRVFFLLKSRDVPLWFPEPWFGFPTFYWGRTLRHSPVNFAKVLIAPFLQNTWTTGSNLIMGKVRGFKCFISHTKETADLVTFTEKILNAKFHFLCSVWFSIRACPYSSLRCLLLHFLMLWKVNGKLIWFPCDVISSHILGKLWLLVSHSIGFAAFSHATINSWKKTMHFLCYVISHRMRIWCEK